MTDIKEKEVFHIIVIDDDITNLKVAGTILSENEMHATGINSGKGLLDHIAGGVRPDLILLDILMPEMDGFETYDKLRKLEAQHNIKRIPVIFLSADEDKATENKCYSIGAVDYIKKPFEEAVLIEKVTRAVTEKNIDAEDNVIDDTDPLTGLPGKRMLSRMIGADIRNGKGTMLLLDFDGFAAVNSRYGTPTGDMLLALFADILKHSFRSGDLIGRIGGNTFLVFLKGSDNPASAVKIVVRLNEQLRSKARDALGTESEVPLGLSGGAAAAQVGSSYSELYGKAERALRDAKESGGHECRIYLMNDDLTPDQLTAEELHNISAMLDERKTDRHALWLGQESFGNIYRYMIRHIRRYSGSACKVLIILTPSVGGLSDDELAVISEKFGRNMCSTLRSSDIMMRSAPNKFFLFLPRVNGSDIHRVLERIRATWAEKESSDMVTFSYAVDVVGNSRAEQPEINGIDWRFARNNLPTDKMLTDTVADFFRSMPGRINRLDDNFSHIDTESALNSYRIEVHAMKSAAAMIGMMPLSGIAKMLEDFARAKDTGRIRTLHGLFAEQWRKAYRDIGTAFGYTFPEEQAKKDGTDVLPGLLENLSSALDDMDIDTVEKIMSEIMSYSYDSKTAETLVKLKRSAMELDDDAGIIIKELLK